MAALTGRTIRASYIELLKLNTTSTNTGVTGSLIDVTDGGNTASALSISTSQIASSVDGSAGTAAFTRKGDTNTGVFFPAADTIAVTTTGTERMRVTSTGFVGIGTTAPGSQLSVSGGTTNVNLGQLSSNASFSGISLGSATTVAAENYNLLSNAAGTDLRIGRVTGGDISFTENNGTAQVIIKTGGNVGIGTTSPPAAKLDVNGKVSIQDYMFLGIDRAGAKISIDANINSGIVGIDVKSLQSANNNSFITFTNLSGNLAGSITHNGTTTVLYNTSSDYRLKEITGPVVTSGAFIDALKPKFGSWKEDGSKFVGFLAHEFAEVSASSVSGEKDATNSEGNPIYQSMQASSPEVMANIVAELQSIRQRLTALEAA